MKRITTMLILLTLIMLVLPGCRLYTNNYKEAVLEYAMITDSDDLSKLDEYPNLEYVDLRGSTCYDAILAYAEAHPDVTVRYNISFGKTRYDASDAEIILSGPDTDFDLLFNNLKYFPKLETVRVDNLSISKAELDKLIATYPDVSFLYTVDLCGEQYDHTTQELDLSNLPAEEIDHAIQAISLLPQLRQVNLISQVSDRRISIGDVTRLSLACPNVVFNYEFFLFGQKISTLSDVITFDGVNIGNDGVAQLREVMPILKQCRSLRLDDCGIDNDVAAQLRSDFPEMNVAWRIYAGRYNMMTDEEMIRMQNTLTNQQAEVLKYCTNVKYMDLQGSKITHIAFAEYMPNLECVVLTNTKAEDITPLAGCPNLTWLEMSNCHVSDLQCLSSLRNLKYLNISNTTISDLSTLDNIPLERFNSVKSYVSKNELQLFKDKHPDCFITTTGNTLGYGWRYEDERLSKPFPYFAHMQEVFRYNEKGYTGNRKEN